MKSFPIFGQNVSDVKKILCINLCIDTADFAWSYSAFSYSMNQKCFPFYFAKTSSNFVKMVLIDTASSELAIKNRVWILLFDSFSIIIFSCSSPDPTTNYEIVILLIQVWLVIYCLLFSSNNHIGLWQFRNKPQFRIR